MNYGKPIARGLTLGAMLLCASLPAAAQWTNLPVPGQPPAGMATRTPDDNPITLGRRAELLGDLNGAAGHYEAALKTTMAQIAQYPAPLQALGHEKLRTVLPHYARVMMQLGRLQEAEIALEHLRALPATPPPSGGGAGFDVVRQVLGALGSAGQQASAGMMYRTMVDGDAAQPLEQTLRARLPPTDVPSALLAELRARQGRSADVLALWQQDFQNDMRRLQQNDGLLFVTADNLVAAAWRMALALQAVGATGQAREAAQIALDQDRQRIRRWAEDVALVDVQLGGMLQHRRLAALSVQGALQAIANRTDADRAMRQALGAVAVSKGLPLRLAMRRRALLAEIDGIRSRSMRADIDRLETELLQIPTDGETGMRDWADWANRYALAWQPWMPQLKQAGLGRVVADPEPLLSGMLGGLAPNEALVGFVVHEPLSFASPTPAPARLVRYTLDATGISLRDVGPLRDIERLVSVWRSNSDPTRQLATGRQLSVQLLKDLSPAVHGATRWVIDPDGLLALLPFEALPDESGQLLVARRTIRYVSSLAQLADTRGAPRLQGHATALVLADPAYADRRTHVDTTPTGRLLRDAVFTPLTDTRAEGEAVRASLKATGADVRLLLGAQATPQTLRDAGTPAYLHVASHAFVLPALPAADRVHPPWVRMVVPGLLAGLALAPDKQGAVFSANELAMLNLRQTRLVVLSACDTGNGNWDTHEGLVSLRRAAEEAGARSTITSLWPVPSAATTQLMSSVYQQMATGLSPAEALRQAKWQQQQLGRPVREWAGFILAGDGR